MTRQKKEIIKRMDELYIQLETDYEMGCGCVPVSAFDPYYEAIEKLEEELAHLRHFSSREEEFAHDVEIEEKLFLCGKYDYLPFM